MFATYFRFLFGILLKGIRKFAKSKKKKYFGKVRKGKNHEKALYVNKTFSVYLYKKSNFLKKVILSF